MSLETTTTTTTTLSADLPSVAGKSVFFVAISAEKHLTDARFTDTHFT